MWDNKPEAPEGNTRRVQVHRLDEKGIQVPEDVPEVRAGVMDKATIVRRFAVPHDPQPTAQPPVVS